MHVATAQGNCKASESARSFGYMVWFVRNTELAHRYAIYFSPATASHLGAFGAEWLGRTVEGQDLSPPTFAYIDDESWRVAVASPRAYGFHATLKPPFRLHDSYNENDFLSAVEAFSVKSNPVGLGSLSISQVSTFLALTSEYSDGIGRLASALVMDFDDFRAPLTTTDVAKYRMEDLSATQQSLIDRWGSPFVMGDFRFHMTLTGSLAAGEIGRFQDELRARFAPLIDLEFQVDEICIFQQRSEDEDLLLSHRFSLKADPV